MPPGFFAGSSPAVAGSRTPRWNPKSKAERKTRHPVAAGSQTPRRSLDPAVAGSPNPPAQSAPTARPAHWGRRRVRRASSSPDQKGRLGPRGPKRGPVTIPPAQFPPEHDPEPLSLPNRGSGAEGPQCSRACGLPNRSLGGSDPRSSWVSMSPDQRQRLGPRGPRGPAHSANARVQRVAVAVAVAGPRPQAAVALRAVALRAVAARAELPQAARAVPTEAE